ncbi:AGAP001531-PA-like protein [Anopheles sinensis]|uniref:AGAP001531-PA-like protein n=1 Tax=Anopheles sinensis TaxID=74873 RepID=A0A084VFP3_ANOSI|nr:AGAP001531-PA-like protein [Anopheles sinensis]
MVHEEEELRYLRDDTQTRSATINPTGRSGKAVPLSLPDSDVNSESWIRRGLHFCSPTRRLPILSWIRRYDGEDFISDLIAGITLGLTMIPQSIAYATIAGLPTQYGLYAAFMGSLVYVFFGTVKEVSIGPTSLMSLLTLQYTAGRPPGYVIVLAFASGLVELAMGVFRLGFLVCFISAPVTSAFTSATALIIIGVQLRNLLGIPRPANGDGGFFGTVLNVLGGLGEAKLGDTALGVGCIVLLVALQQLPKCAPARGNPFLRRTLWYVSLARNALVVLASAVLAYHLAASSADGSVPFRLSGNVEPGLPSFEWPVRGVTVGNTTVPFLEVTAQLGSGLLLVPLVAVLANVAIAKAFASETVVDATQELLALGLCNLVGSCFRAMPTTGAFTRSAVSQASGVRTPLSGLYSALLTLLALGVLTPYFYYIPRATLAAVLIAAVTSMVDFGIVRRLPRPPRHSPADLLSWALCFTVCLLLGVELGLLCGMAVSLLEPLRHSVLPRADCTTETDPTTDTRYRRIRPRNVPALLYPGIDRLRKLVLAETHRQLTEASGTPGGTVPLPLVLDCERLVALDFSSARALRELTQQVHQLGGTLYLRDVPAAWRSSLQLTETAYGLAIP